MIRRRFTNRLIRGKTTNNKMKELIEQIKQWGVDKGITGPNGKGTLLGQLSKTQEELTETRDAAVRVLDNKAGIARTNATLDLIDGIGDCTVTLILAAEMAGIEFEDCLQAAYDEIEGRTGTMVNGVFVKNAKGLATQPAPQIPEKHK
jgi:NTP pyrophosphatase (non-canonical NTP hydrolase)